MPAARVAGRRSAGGDRGEATDSADATPLVPNALAPVDRRYSELEATRSPLGAPIGAQTTGPGTTVRRLYERG